MHILDTRRKKKSRPLRIAIVGLPNSGKSHVFNNLTGDYTLVANYPLTTVEMMRKICTIRNREYELIDTPGLHSLYIHSEEEIVVRDLLFNEKLDGIIQCIDANRLKQSLLLTLDLIELEIPLVISLNAIDETQQHGVRLSAAKLSESLGVPVVEHNPPLNRGTERLRRTLSEMRTGSWRPFYGESLEKSIASIAALLPDSETSPRKKALLLLAGDYYLLESLGDEDREKINSHLDKLGRESHGKPALPINDLRGDIVGVIASNSTSRQKVLAGQFSRIFADLSRHPVYGIPILAFFLFTIYLLVVNVAGYIEQGLSALIVDPVTAGIDSRLAAGFWKDFLIGDYGILTLGLFNAFVTVLPILSMFFLMLGLLEDIGYLPNLSVLARRILQRIGLSGKSVMSLVLGFGCKTMATLTTKGITSKKEKFIAVYLIAFAIPCSAQMAVEMGILGRVGFSAFLIAFGFLILVELAAGFVLNKLTKDDTKTDFIQELPPIRMPHPKAILKKTGYRLYWFLKEAVPIFFIAAVALFLVDRIGLLDLLKTGLKPVIVTWLGLPLNMVEVLILSFARHEAAAGLLLNMVDMGGLNYIQSIVAVVITTMFVPCFANIVAMCRTIGVGKGIVSTLVINISSFVLAGILNWVLIFFKAGV